ncbi:MAG: DUF1566 domain-containing protein [Sulfurovum sp.]|nr:DUF1566 domain-containing protein [Sulfurovum sp.]
MRTIFWMVLIFSTLVWAELTKTNDIVDDNITKLQWQDNETISDFSTIDWEASLAYCEALELGGNLNWRLPNIKELTSIVDRDTFNPAMSNVFGFADTNFIYWSASTYYETTDHTYAWGISFGAGGQNSASKSNSNNVRCVRDSE